MQLRLNVCTGRYKIRQYIHLFINQITDLFISHNGANSLHAQLYSRVRDLIMSGHWPYESRVPSEVEIARYLRISRSTVRLALQQAELEGLIKRIAGRGTFVAYQPLRERENRIIAFLTSALDSESHPLIMMLRGAENEAKARGYHITFNNVQNHREETDRLLRIQGDEVAGILLWPNAVASHALPGDSFSYQHIRLPLVLLDRQVYGLDCDCVTSDNYGGARALMTHLVGLGHRQIVFLSHHETDLLPVKERYRAYQDVMSEAGLTPLSPWLIGQPGNEMGAKYTLQSTVDVNSAELQELKAYMLGTPERTTAIFALHDYLAILAVRALRLLDIRVPDQVSVAGFDDNDPAVHLEVLLTTVAQDPFSIGKQAAGRLIDRIEGYAGPTECQLIPTQLRVRSSTAPVYSFDLKER
jgi:GntR family transcriptional regulator, arabinose operon transcriptional repressor